jgi:hypothetical protein
MKLRPFFLFSTALLGAPFCPSSGAQDELDAVAEGRQSFEVYGCVVCHAVDQNDASVRTGPSLHGLFLSQPRSREVLDPQSNTRKIVRADKAYYLDSVRKAWDHLAIAESGPTRGMPYPAAMPLFSSETLPEPVVENIWHYLRTLAEGAQSGPARVMLKPSASAVVKNILDVPGEEPVAQRTRVMRAPVLGASGRALHVGLPNGVNYSFDERFLSVRNIWSGGYLNLAKEREGRGQPGSERGRGWRLLHEDRPVLQPLDAAGAAVDLEFKQPDVLDEAAVERWLSDDRTFAEQLRAHAGTQFLGHQLDPKSGDPLFLLRVGRNHFSERVGVTADSRFEIFIEGDFSQEQPFALHTEGLVDVQTEGGTLSGQTWKLPAGKGVRARFSAMLPGGLVARPLIASGENWSPQPVVKRPAESGKLPLQIPAGYRVEDWESPRDLFGRSQVFEPTGIAVAKDGTLVIGTRTAGIWRIRDNVWSLFAEGTYECLGVVIEDDAGDRIVVIQKPQLTRITDTDHDGRADRFETLFDGFGFHANYHEYAHGPVRDGDGNYYVTLNLSHGKNEKSSWRAGGPFMGSMGGYRGWAFRVRPDGTAHTFANGLRSPAGLGFDPEGRLWYAENQGEYVGSSKWVPLEEGRFYGHISGLLDLPQKRMRPDSPELDFALWKDRIRKAAVWLPHGKLANSPGNPAWDTTGGKFGPYARQVFIGDQTLSTLLRITTETVEGSDQGCVVPFIFGAASGVMRPVFLPDGSLLLGQTGRGWAAKGGSRDKLQRVVYDGKKVPADIHSVRAHHSGFTVHFTQPLSGAVGAETVAASWKVQSWFYTDGLPYGSPEHDKKELRISAARISPDRLSALLEIDGFGGEGAWTDRIYHIRLDDTRDFFAPAEAWTKLESYYTLRSIPKS